MKPVEPVKAIHRHILLLSFLCPNCGFLQSGPEDPHRAGTEEEKVILEFNP